MKVSSIKLSSGPSPTSHAYGFGTCLVKDDDTVYVTIYTKHEKLLRFQPLAAKMEIEFCGMEFRSKPFVFLQGWLEHLLYDYTYFSHLL